MTTQAPSKLPETALRSATRAALMIAFAVAILLAALYAWVLLQRYGDILRPYALASAIVAGIGATLALAGAMHVLDLPMSKDITGCDCPWYLRLVLKTKKRILLAGQLAAMALAAGAAILLLFGFPIPGTTP